MATTYRIKIAKADQEFEAEGDKAFVLEMLKRFDSGSHDEKKFVQPEKNTKAKSGSEVALPAVGKKISVGEFIRQIGFKKHTDLVLSFGYYLEKHAGFASFTPADINTCYYDSKMESSNTSQMIIQNIRRGFIMEAKKDKGRKSYTLTRTGEEHIINKSQKAIKQ
jgi:hypothetical protein